MKNCLGVYFTDKKIYICEQARGKLAGVYSGSLGEFGISKSSDKNILLVASLQKGLRGLKAATTQVVLGLSSQKSVFRFFRLPIMPKSEIREAIGFEVEKYLPFGINEFIWDFNYRVLRKEKEVEICFAGIPRHEYDLYVRNLKGADLELIGFSSSILTLWGFLERDRKISSVKTYMFIEISSEGSNILIVNNKFPCFQRDVKFPEEETEEKLFSRFIDEVRISFEYYQRRYQGEDIKNIYFICDYEYEKWADALKEEFNINLDILSPKQLLGNDAAAAGHLNAFALSLLPLHKFPVQFDFTKREQEIAEVKVEEPREVVFNRHYIYLSALLSVLIFSVVFGRDFAQIRESRKALKEEKNTSLKRHYKHLDTISKIQSTLAEEKGFMDLITSEQNLSLKVSPILEVIGSPSIQGLWVDNMDFKIKDIRVKRQNIRKKELVLEGYVYRPDEHKQIEAVNEFLVYIKENPVFKETFSEMAIEQVMRTIIRGEYRGRYEVIKFRIVCNG